MSRFAILSKPRGDDIRFCPLAFALPGAMQYLNLYKFMRFAGVISCLLIGVLNLMALIDTFNAMVSCAFRRCLLFSELHRVTLCRAQRLARP